MRTILLAVFAIVTCWFPICRAAEAPAKIDLQVQQWNGNAICYSGFRAGQSPRIIAFLHKLRFLKT